jgi:hypothetical protein
MNSLYQMFYKNFYMILKRIKHKIIIKILYDFLLAETSRKNVSMTSIFSREAQALNELNEKSVNARLKIEYELNPEYFNQLKTYHSRNSIFEKYYFGFKGQFDLYCSNIAVMNYILDNELDFDVIYDVGAGLGQFSQYMILFDHYKSLKVVNIDNFSQITRNEAKKYQANFDTPFEINTFEDTLINPQGAWTINFIPPLFVKAEIELYKPRILFIETYYLTIYKRQHQFLFESYNVIYTDPVISIMKISTL